MENNSIVIYENQNGVQVDVRMREETMWLTQKQIAYLFGAERSVVTKHIRNIIKSEELQQDAVCANFAHTAEDGKLYNVDFYNLDMIIAVGYRVNSKNATAFRRWATDVLKKYLVDGYAVNENRLAVAQDKIKTLVQFVDLLKRTAENQIENLDPQMKELLDVAGKFATGFEMLDNYDHEELATTGATKTPAAQVSVDEFLTEIKKMTAQFGGLFGVVRDGGFDSSVGQIYQSFGGKELYPTIEEKAATLLYLVTKNHAFVDGNKRIAAFCFIYFLARNNLLFIDGRKIIDDAALAAMTLLVAQSDPAEMDTIKRVIITILNNGGKR
jgi:prophage maintenance system killer protein/prophage antirepressor-like protein